MTSLNERRIKLRKLKALALATMMTANPIGSCAQTTEKSDKDDDKVVEIGAEYRQSLEENGHFYVNSEKFEETKSYEQSVVYLTNDEIQSLGINSYNTTIYDVSLARENGIQHSDDNDKYMADMATALSKTKGVYNGAFQFDDLSSKNMILWGIVQEKSPEIREFCKNFARSGINLNTNKGMERYKETWNSKMGDVEDGKLTLTGACNWLCSPTSNKSRAGALSCVNVTKANFHKVCENDTKGAYELQKLYVCDMMLPSSKYYKTLRQASPEVSACVIMSVVHGPNYSSTKDIVANQNMKDDEKCMALINAHDCNNKNCHNRMTTARENITNKGYVSVSYYQSYFDYFPTEEKDKKGELEKGIENACVAEAYEQSTDSNVQYVYRSAESSDVVSYAAVVTDHDKTSQSVARKLGMLLASAISKNTRS